VPIVSAKLPAPERNRHALMPSAKVALTWTHWLSGSSAPRLSAPPSVQQGDQSQSPLAPPSPDV
jgi:hypothetical protein